MSSNQLWYTIKDVDQIDSPALLVYLSRVRKNIRLLKEMVNGDTGRLRPHVKTNKSSEAVDLLIGAGIYQFKCATIAEAEMLGRCGARDVLLAYQPVGPKLGRYVDLIKQYPDTTFSCLTDNIDHAKAVSSVAKQHNLTIQLYLDLNVGMDRTGISTGIKANRLYQRLHLLKHVIPMGIHAYDGHLHDADISVRRQKSQRAFQGVWDLVSEMERLRYPRPLVVAGGSPTFPIHAEDNRVVCSPGTFIYWDNGYREGLAEQHFIFAAVVLTRVISLPTSTTLCLDLGHKSIAAENVLEKRVHFLNAPQLKPVSQSEEHLVVEVEQGHRWKVGDVLYAVPYHICPTVALYEQAFAINKGEAAGIWPIQARDRKITV